jgi:hypothetical protein
VAVEARVWHSDDERREPARAIVDAVARWLADDSQQRGDALTPAEARRRALTFCRDGAIGPRSRSSDVPDEPPTIY